MSELTESLLAPQDKSTGQSFTFIASIIPELLTVFEGSTQRERTIDQLLHL